MIHSSSIHPRTSGARLEVAVCTAEHAPARSLSQAVALVVNRQGG